MDVGRHFSPPPMLWETCGQNSRTVWSHSALTSVFDCASGTFPLRTRQCLRLRFGDIKHRRDQDLPILLDDNELLYNLKVDPNVWFACEKRNP